MPRVTKDNPITNYVSREELSRIREGIRRATTPKPLASTPCLICGQPVTWAMWQRFTPCPSSKDKQSGHMLTCSPDSLGVIAPR